MNKRILAGLLALSLSGCATDGGVDWNKVGTGVAAVGVGLLVVTAAVVAAQPTPITTTCRSWGNTSTCTTY